MNATPPPKEIKRIKPPTAQQGLAAEPERSVWVSANAGTGKTRVLVDRIARLLLAGTRPEKILCLTFTKTGAAEMAKRINEQLGRWALMDETTLAQDLHALTGREADTETLTTAAKLFARVLDVPGGLKIRTIHAFCESLVARFPIEAGVAPHFSVIDERTTAEYLIEARERILLHTVAHPGTDLARALSHLAEWVNEDDFTALMQELTNKRAHLRQAIETLSQGGSIPQAVSRLVGLGDDEGTADAILQTAIEAIDVQAMTRAADALMQGAPTSQKMAAKIKAFFALAIEQRAETFVQDYADIFVTQEHEPRKKLATKGAEAAEEILTAEQTRVLGVLEKLRARATADATASLLSVGEAMLAEYEHIKRVRACLDYDDLIERASALLSTEDNGVGWVHYKLDGGIDHILVDESQDTSPQQWNVVKNLAEDFYAGLSRHEETAAHARTVFAVGDEKQSIYSFQGADPHEFGRMRQHFKTRVQAAGLVFSDAELIISFRSTHAMLNVVDRVFAQAQASDGLTFNNQHVVHDSHRKGDAGLVELWPTVKPLATPEDEPWDAPLDYQSEASPDLRLADQISATIKGWLDTNEKLIALDRPIRPGDILILVRERKRFAEAMVRSLKKHAIPVAGADRMVLTDQLAVMDLLAAGHFAVLPEDDLSLAEVLKSPLVGLDEQALFDLAYGRAGGLWAELKRRHAERDDFARAFEGLSGLLARADTRPPYEFYAGLLQEGGRQAFLRRLGTDAEDPIDEFLNLALEFEHNHTPSLQGFLHWVTASNQQIKRDLETTGNEVRVMTVHGAKGLEAPIVFLTDTCKGPNKSKGSRLQWPVVGLAGDSEATAMLWSPLSELRCQIFKDCVENGQVEREREYRRLLYVAMTRARDRLYITGFEGSQERAEGCWYDLMAPVVQGLGKEITLSNGEPAWRYETPQTADIKQETPASSSAPAGEAPAWLTQPAPREPSPSNPLQPSRPSIEAPPAFGPFDALDEHRFKRGLLVHKLLETLPALPPHKRHNAAQAWLAQPAHELNGDIQAAILSETLAVLDHPDFADLFAPDSLAEVAISGVLGDQVVSARLDRLAVSESCVTVIDYKTNRPAPTELKNVPEPYLRQMALYRALLENIYPGKRIRCVLLWTDGPHIMALDDDILRAYAP
ncbi:MAG: double-strand break repair helicase AddA [Rhodospirillales bacterium]|nr:double-strand break repair helicase AddA [Rhodospirillales bacterium]